MPYYLGGALQTSTFTYDAIDRPTGGTVGRYNSQGPQVGAEYSAKVRATFEDMLTANGR